MNAFLVISCSSSLLCKGVKGWTWMEFVSSRRRLRERGTEVAWFRLPRTVDGFAVTGGEGILSFLSFKKFGMALSLLTLEEAFPRDGRNGFKGCLRS